MKSLILMRRFSTCNLIQGTKKSSYNREHISRISSYGWLRAPSSYRQARFLFVGSHLFHSHGVDAQQVSASNLSPNLSLKPHVDKKLSYAYGRSGKELKYLTLGPMMDSMCKKEPHSTAVVVYDEGVSKSFEELNNDVNRLVNGMVGVLGLKRGDRIGLYSYNCYQFLLVQFACLKLGCTLTSINPSYKSHEFSYVLEKAAVKVLFTTGRNSRQSPLNDHWSVVKDVLITSPQKNKILSELKDIVVLDGELDGEHLNANEVTVHRWRAVFSLKHELDSTALSETDTVSSDDIYGIYYTSGTTGFPKGATITQYNALNNTALTFERLFNQRGPKYQPMRPNICLPLPLFHEFAGVLGVIGPFVGGGSFVLPGIRYNIQSVVESIIRFKCNTIFLTPTILIDLMAYVERNELSGKLPLRSLLIAGSPVMSELVKKAQKMLPELEEFRIGYGSSENGVIASVQTSQEPMENRPYTVGPPLDFTEIRIVDTNTGQTTQIGQSGEVQTRGFNTMLYYFNDPDKSDEAITKSRWYKTGDLGILDKHGSLQIVGRIKDLIIKGGENIYPAEVETVLHAHEAIEDAHVFGVPDKRFGEEVAVWVKLKRSDMDEDATREAIIEYCKKKLTYFKVPKYVIFVDEFPLTPVKKIKKFEMRAQTAKMLNLE